MWYNNLLLCNEKLHVERMMYMMPPGPPPGAGQYKYDKVAPPRGISDLPRYLGELLRGFFERMGYICRLVWKTGPWILVCMVLVALFQGFMPVVGSLISRQVLNALQEGYGGFEGDIVAFLGSSVCYLLIFLFVYNILNSLVGMLSHTVTRIAGELVVRTVKMEIMHKAKELDLSSFDLPAFYAKLENANREAGMRPIQILSSTFSVFSAIITLVSYVVVLVTSDMWWASLVMIAVSIPSAVITFRYRRKNFQYMRFRSKDRRQMSYYADVMVNKDLVKEVRMFDLADTFIGRYRDTFDRYYAGIRRLIWKENAWHVVITVVSAVVNCGFFLWFAYLVVTGKSLIGDYTLYTGALGAISAQVSTLITLSATVYEGTLFIDNLTSFLGEKQTVVPIIPEGSDRSEPLRVNHGSSHTLVFEHVSFSYPGSDRLVLDDINLTIRPGETLVLVGLNGAGKTTLLKLLTRLYDPTAGRILLDGHDIREYDVSDLYRMYGIIFQDFGKYAVSVSENIRFGDVHREASEADIRRAAAESNVEEYINRLPQGFDTPLMRVFEEEGVELSIGQWQKLAIARAFYSESDVLILDEPTASLDPMAEQEIFNQFDRLRKDKTTIFVSHRLSSATVASKIVVLEYGKLIEEGDHKSLMAKRGRYYELFSTQAKRYMTDAEQGGDAERAHDMPPMGMPPMGRPPMGRPSMGRPPVGREPFDKHRAEGTHPDIS